LVLMNKLKIIKKKKKKNKFKLSTIKIKVLKKSVHFNG
jgi:hypothetical protein